MDLIARLRLFGLWNNEGRDCVGNRSKTLLPVALHAVENMSSSSESMWENKRRKQVSL